MRFRYLRDPLFLGCLALYFLNRWLLKPYAPLSFFRDHLNDLICIPFWVPIMLWGMRRLGLRANDRPPQWHEILVPLLLWSYLFEVLLPGLGPFRHRAIADPGDVLAYTTGALLAAILWRRYYGSASSAHGVDPAHRERRTGPVRQARKR